MSEISLFNKYHGKENTVTNYCGLMLKLLYQSSPVKFQNCISNLIDTDKTSIIIGPVFKQRTNRSEIKKEKSIIDLGISQQKFDIVFEVKKYDWFYKDQIEKYFPNIAKDYSNKEDLAKFLNGKTWETFTS